MTALPDPPPGLGPEELLAWIEALPDDPAMAPIWAALVPSLALIANPLLARPLLAQLRLQRPTTVVAAMRHATLVLGDARRDGGWPMVRFDADSPEARALLVLAARCALRLVDFSPAKAKA